MNENIIFLFIIVIPFLLVITSAVVFQFYQKQSRQRNLMEQLSNATNQILEDKKRKVVSSDTDSSLKKKLYFGGFNHHFSVEIFLLISLSFGTLVGLFLYMVMGSKIVSLLSAMIFSFFPYLVLGKIVANRLEEFNYGLKAMIDKVTSMMKSGVGFEQSLKKSIATSKSELTKSIFETYLKEKDIIGEEKSFQKMFKMVESKELRIFYLVVSIGRQSGGKFSSTLDTLRKTLHDQGVIKQEIMSSTKEIRVGTFMIIGLTIGIFFMLDAVFNGVMSEYFFTTKQGQIQMFFIIIWVAFGLFVNNLLTKIKD